MKEKVEEVFNALKELDMKPTPNNVSIMDGVYSFLREIYKELEEAENGGTENGAEVDPDGRNQD
jgi:hypothetical protein